MAQMILGIDFDGTCVTHRYPEIGAKNPFALKYLRLFVQNGAKLVLYTVRDKEQLDEAVAYLEANSVKLYGINENPQQKHWNTSRKVHCNLYIDDAAYGVPLIDIDGSPCVNWRIVGPAVNNIIIQTLGKQK